MLTLNLNLLYTVVNILVLFLLLRKFLYKPVMNIIAQRQKQVDLLFIPLAAAAAIPLVSWTGLLRLPSR